MSEMSEIRRRRRIKPLDGRQQDAGGVWSRVVQVSPSISDISDISDLFEFRIEREVEKREGIV